jgi:5,10-methylenetetrahydromethanopterin reductase
VTWEGGRFRLAGAQLTTGRREIPIWVAARGDRMLELAGRSADGVVLMARADLGSALEVVQRGSAGRPVKPQRVYLDRIAYTPAMLEEAATLYGYTILDSPPRLLRNLGLSEAEIDEIRQTAASEGAEAALRLVTLDMIRRYQIAGTPEECRRLVGELIRAHRIDTFLLDIVSGGLAANIRLMRDTREIVLAG